MKDVKGVNDFATLISTKVSVKPTKIPALLKTCQSRAMGLGSKLSPLFVSS